MQSVKERLIFGTRVGNVVLVGTIGPDEVKKSALSAITLVCSGFRRRGKV